MKRRWKILALVLVLLLAAAGAFFYLSGRTPKEIPPTFHSQLTGEEVGFEQSRRPVLGIMVENTPAARPQTGLDSAGIVFETVTEGGITRMLALYQADTPDTIGPIRSLRPYFVDWVTGFDVSIAHVGGSGEALEMVDQRGLKSLNQFEYDQPYYRDENRPAPHNMYARTDGLRDLQEELGHGKSRFKKIPRSDGSQSQNPQATNIAINYSTPEYAVEYRHQEESNTYTRHLAGSPHIDAATDEPISTKNIVVIKMPRDTIEALGSGSATVFRNGEAHKGEWRKPDHQERIEIIDNEGEQVPLNRGDTWFAVLPGDKSVNY